MIVSAVKTCALKRETDRVDAITHFLENISGPPVQKVSDLCQEKMTKYYIKKYFMGRGAEWLA